MSHTTSCVLCGKSERSVFMHFDEANIVECDGCGLCYATHVPTREAVRQRYSSRYFKDSYRTSLDLEAPRQVGKKLLERIRRYRNEGKLLDVGCGAGDYLAVAHSHGWECYGLDISEFAVELAGRLSGVHVYAGFLDEVGFDYDFFDAAIMIHSLEHQLDPVAVLTELYRILKPGGVLFISVPNLNSREARRAGKSWRGFQVGHHFYFFMPATLRKMVEQAGFRVLELETPMAIVSGRSVDRLMGHRLGGALRSIVRRILGRPLDFVRCQVARFSEGESVILIARKLGG